MLKHGSFNVEGKAVDLRTLVARGAGGDVAAFTELVQRYQGMAFGYAFAILRDFHLAQDAAQEAFIAAYFSLATLEDGEKFPGWLRGIVRHQCGRLLRRRRVATVPLDHAVAVAVDTPGPDRQAEEGDALARVLAAIDALPPSQREVTTLFYRNDYSQQEVARFLELPVTTVNNRLHAARKGLKGELLPMARDAFAKNRLPDDFAANVGRIIEARGPVVDARFAPDSLPAILDTLTVTDEARQVDVTVEVAQHLGNDVVRGIVVSPVEGAIARIGPGMAVVNAERLASHAVDRGTVQMVPTLLSQPAAGTSTEVLETGIKAIDLLCPSPEGQDRRLQRPQCRQDGPHRGVGTQPGRAARRADRLRLRPHRR